MSLYRRGKTWWLYIVHQGIRIRQSCQTSDRAGAQKIHDQVRAELWKIRPAGPTFYAALEAWKQVRPRDPADLYRIDKFRRAFLDRPAALVTAEDLAMAIPNSSPATFNRYANLITAALGLAKARNWIDTVPRIERQGTPPGRLRWLTPQEWRRLRRELPEHLRDMAEFALLTGLRQRNVTHLEWSQVDLRRKMAWIHADQAKGRQPIGVPLSNAACAILRGRRGQSETWVFPYKGKPMGKIKTAWRKALRRAGIEGFTWHDLRHTWASWHVQAGTPIPVLKELGGWRTLTMVNRYAHLAPEHLRQYVGNVSRHSRHTQGHKKCMLSGRRRGTGG